MQRRSIFVIIIMVQKVASINIQRRNIMPGHYGKKMKKPSMVKKAKKKKNKKKK
jgi:hypothetical protein|tara:strand:- start:249 stop:410 length:162 start_codon:yes stop_codon:yes gene_type:complete